MAIFVKEKLNVGNPSVETQNFEWCDHDFDYKV